MCKRPLFSLEEIPPERAKIRGARDRQAMLKDSHGSLALLVGEFPKPPLNTEFHSVAARSCGTLFTACGAERTRANQQVSGPDFVPLPGRYGAPARSPSADPHWPLRSAVPAFPRGRAGTPHRPFSCPPTAGHTRPASS